MAIGLLGETGANVARRVAMDCKLANELVRFHSPEIKAKCVLGTVKKLVLVMMFPAKV